MTDQSVSELVRALEGLTDRQRLDFMRWAATQPDPLAPSPERSGAFLERPMAEEAAEHAFAALRNDGTVAAPPRWEFMFDPCFPETGWDALRAARIIVRAMARSLAAGDYDAVAGLAPAFERLATCVRSDEPGTEHGPHGAAS